MVSTRKRAYEYFKAFEDGLSDGEVAQRLRVSVETVEKYRQLVKYYDLEDLENIVIGMRRQRAHLSTIYKAVRRDPRFRPFDDMFLLAAIYRRIRKAGRVISEMEVRAALKYAFDPEVHDEALRTIFSRLVPAAVADG